MKRLILFLAVATSCMGQGLTLRSPLRDGAIAAPCPVVNQDFESTGLPCNWVVGAGTPNWDNTSSPIDGAQDLKFDDSANSAAYSLFTAAPEVFIQMELKLTSLPTSSDNILFLYNSGGSQYLLVQLLFSGELFIVDYDFASNAQTTDILSAATRYWIFIHVLKGTGVNASYSVEFSTTSTRVGSGNKFATIADGHLTSDMIQFRAARDNTLFGAGKTYQIDNVKFSTTGWPP